MTGCIAQRNGIYYVRLTYYDQNHKRKDKWVTTGLSGKGAKQKATALIESFIEKYSYLETSSHPTKMVDYLKMWKALQTKEVAETTFDGYIHSNNRGTFQKFLSVHQKSFSPSPRDAVTYSRVVPSSLWSWFGYLLAVLCFRAIIH